MDESFSYVFIIGFLILSAFFSGSETAFFSLSKIQLKQLEKQENKKSKRILKLLRKPKQLLIIILFGNTIVNVAASSVAALIAIDIGQKFFKSEHGFVPIFIEIFVMTMLLLIFGEITPKLLAFSSPEKFVGFSGIILIFFKTIFYPFVKFVDFVSSLFTRKSQDENNPNLTTEDFRNLISSKATEESLEENEKQIIDSIFKFSSIIVREIMIPRVDIEALELSEGMNKLKEKIINSGHSKIPIFKKSIDNIIGVVYAKDVILEPEKKTIHSLLRPAFFITENMKIQNLLNQFKNKKIQFAVIVDEYGGTMGIITLEDILEELFGEILDEYDKEEPMVQKKSETEYILNGMLMISEMNEEFNLIIDEEEYDNLAEFLYDNFNKVPKNNESFIYNDLAKFTITNIKGQRINSVKMILLNPEKK